MFKKILSQCPINFATILFVLLGCFSPNTWSAMPKFELLYSFGKTEGADSPIVHDAAGNHYGIYSKGGDFGSGLIFKIDPTGKYNIAYMFDGKAAPKLISTNNGKFYGWSVNTNPTSTKSNAVIYELDLSQAKPKFTILYKDAENRGVSDLIQGRNGKLYGTTTGHSGEPYGSIFQLDISSSTSPSYKDIYTFSQSSAVASNLIQGNDNLLYGITKKTKSNNEIFVLDASKTFPSYAVLHDFNYDGYGMLISVNIALGNTDKIYGSINRWYIDGYHATPASMMFQLETNANTPNFTILNTTPWTSSEIVLGCDDKLYYTN